MKLKTLLVTPVLVAALPATALATPPSNLGGPAGSQAGCAIASSPTVNGLTGVGASCNFKAGSQSLGYAAESGFGVQISHVQKVNVCQNGVVVGYAAHRAVDVSATPAVSDSYLGVVADPNYQYVTGRVYTLTVLGLGSGFAGGPGTPGADSTAEPATPGPANNWAGAEDLSSPLNSAC